MLGVLGGGQLGRMWAHAAQTLGYTTAVLDPDPHSPAGLVSHLHLCADYLDPQALAQMAQQCAAITTEFENVPAQALAQLAQTLPVSPAAASVAVAQDRAQEKAHFTRCGVPVAPHAVLASAADVAAVDGALLPGILKTARLGYDGKGQARVANRTELLAAWQSMQSTGLAMPSGDQAPGANAARASSPNLEAPQPSQASIAAKTIASPPGHAIPSATVCVLEKMLPLAAECSVVLARGQDGHMVHLPVQANLHRDGILAVTEAGDGALDAALAAQALKAAHDVAQGLDYVGVLCVEFFVLQPNAPGGQPSLVVNEIAPRPHNSGHHSIDSCDVSQFDLQVRCMAGLPLVQPRAHSAAVMLNILGDLWWPEAEAEPGAVGAGATAPADMRAHRATDSAHEPDWAAVLALPGAHLHLYGKTQPRRGRKMGHLTCTAPTLAQARDVARQAAKSLGLAPW
jgi:5-(carboxyamino)imidazole ribonucleotide synthase